MANNRLSSWYEKSAGLHHTPHRFATTYHILWEACVIRKPQLDMIRQSAVIQLLAFARSLFEVAIRVAIEQIRCVPLSRRRGKSSYNNVTDKGKS